MEQCCFSHLMWTLVCTILVFRLEGFYCIPPRTLSLSLSLPWQYMEQLLQSGESLEFFLEGSRSRSGKPCTPKAGLLSVVVDTVREGEQSRLLGLWEHQREETVAIGMGKHFPTKFTIGTAM